MEFLTNEKQLEKMKQWRIVNKAYPIHPLSGIIFIIISTFFAALFIPENPHAAGALSISASILAIGIAISPLNSFVKNPKSILRAESILVLSLIYWLLLDLIQGVYELEQISSNSIDNTFISIAVFAIGVWVSSSFPPWVPPAALTKASRYNLNSSILFRLNYVFFFLGMFRYAYPCQFNVFTMIHYLGADRWSAPWARGSLGGWDAFLDHMSYFGYLVPLITTLSWIRLKKTNLNVVIAILLSLIMITFLAQGGGRRVIGVTVGAAIICWILEAPKLSFKKIILAGGMLAAVLLIMQYMLEYRNVGYKFIFSEEKKVVRNSHLRVDDNFLRLGQIIELVPAKHPYAYEKQIIYVVIRPIPRVLWPNKPVDPGFNLPGILGKKGVSLTSSVIGEWYLSGGWIMIFVGGIFYGRLANMASLFFISNNKSSGTIVYSIFLMALFAGMRSMLDLILMSYALLAWVLLSNLLLRITEPSAPQH